MARSKETFGKKEKEKKRLKKRQDKMIKREERKSTAGGGTLDEMIMYIDENGNFSETPPNPAKKTKIDAKSIEIGVPKREEEDEMPAIRNGRVEFFNDSKGYGFIKELETQEKFFFHVNGLIDEVRENDVVSFEIERGLKGLNAVRVKRG